MKCAITGVNGYLGSFLSSYFASANIDVLGMSRKCSDSEQEHCEFSLGESLDQIPWSELDAFVHCSYDFSLSNWNDIKRVNIEGSVAFLRKAHSAGVKRGIFISSFSAFDGCRSFYGKAKLEIEKVALSLGYSVIRPGLIWGEEPQGILGNMVNTVKNGKLIPLIGSGKKPQFLVHEEDLAKLCLNVLSAQDATEASVIRAAHSESIAFKELLSMIAKKHNRSPVFLPIPWQILYLGIRSLELMKIPIGFRSDSVVSFIYQNKNPEFSNCEQHGVKFRPFGL